MPKACTRLCTTVTDPEQDACERGLARPTRRVGTLHRELLWPGSSSAAREGAENAAAKYEPVSTGTLDFFRSYNMAAVSNRPQGDSSGKLQILAKRESGKRDSQLKDFASNICFNSVLGL